MRAEVLHVLFREHGRHRRHQGIDTPALLELLKLRDDIGLVLSRQARPFGVDARAGHAVAGAANRGFLRTDGRVARRGRSRDQRCGEDTADPGVLHARIIYVPVFQGPIPEKRRIPGRFRRRFGCEVAFAGRSNSGKSSALNAIVRRRDLARTSRTPGRTQSVNLFELEPGRRLADLPGYGHANVPVAVRAAWGRLIETYFAERESLAGLFIIADSRRGFGDSDLVDARVR